MAALLAAGAVTMAVPAMAQDRGGDGQERRSGTSERSDFRSPRGPHHQGQGLGGAQADGFRSPRAPAAQFQSDNSDNRRNWDRERDSRRDYGTNPRRDWNRGDESRRDDNRRDWNATPRRDGDRNDWRHSDWGRRDHDRRWNNDWRRDGRYDWQRHRSFNRGIYRLPTYRAPRGWHYGYRSFSVGLYLNNVLFAPTYWISDPWAYRLPPVYGPLRWVRYYDDALLVDVRNGYVVDVIHRFFW